MLFWVCWFWVVGSLVSFVCCFCSFVFSCDWELLIWFLHDLGVSLDLMVCFVGGCNSQYVCFFRSFLLQVCFDVV